jgi:flavodoxin
MKTVVIYKSKSGFVKKYAEWIAEDLSADIFEPSKATPEMLTDYDTVIYGGGLYAVGINGVKLIKQNLDKLKGKKVVVFASGASPSREEIISEVRNKNFTSEQQELKWNLCQGHFEKA